MNILIVSQYFWPENFRINDLASGLAERGHDITVLTGIPNYPDGRFFKGYGFTRTPKEGLTGVRIIRTPMIPRGGGGKLNLSLNYLSFASIAAVYGVFACKGKFDVIFVYEPSPVTVGIPAVFLGKLKSVPVFFWVQDLWPESLSATGAIRSAFILKSVDLLVRYIYKRCNKVLIQSPAFRQKIESQGVKSCDIIFFPNSVEALYRPMPADPDFEKKKLLPKGFRVVFAGNIGEAQAFGSILLAAKKLRAYKDIHWIILGDGRAKQWVEKEVLRLGLGNSVHLMGRHSMEVMPQYFSTADAMLVSLKKDPIFAMTIPAKIQSYMACGKPIIASLDGIGANIVKTCGAGLACPAENPDELASAVLSLYSMPERERKKMGCKAIQYCKTQYDRDMLIKRLERWVENYINDLVKS